MKILRGFIIANRRKSKAKPKIITDERLPRWSLSSMSNIILIIFTTANDSPSLAHRPFDDFKRHRKAKIEVFRKNNMLARQPILSKNPLEPPLDS